MIKNRFIFAGTLCAAFLFSATSVSAQADFNAFWTKFKTAVVNNDKTTVAKMTKFPLVMPYGVKDIRTKASFLKNYANDMNAGGANAARCFQVAKPERDGKTYSVFCANESEPESSDNRPNQYYFVKTKTGWKFAGIDNINE
jgi:hypothetical protein